MNADEYRLRAIPPGVARAGLGVERVARADMREAARAHIKALVRWLVERAGAPALNAEMVIEDGTAHVLGDIMRRMASTMRAVTIPAYEHLDVWQDALVYHGDCVRTLARESAQVNPAEVRAVLNERVGFARADFPFPCTYYQAAPPVEVIHDKLRHDRLLSLGIDPPLIARLWVHGWIVDASGWVVEVCEVEVCEELGRDRSIVADTVRAPTGWLGASFMAPWSVRACVEMVARCGVAMIASAPTGTASPAKVLHMRRRRGRGKTEALRPPDWYTIALRSEPRTHEPPVTNGGGEDGPAFGHTYDVRAHTRLYFYRQPGRPQAPARYRLEALGYTIRETVAPDLLTGQTWGELDRELERRGLPPFREGEWIAYKIVNVRHHQRGAGPYVPARREIQ